MKRFVLLLLLLQLCGVSYSAHPISGLLDRIDPGASRRFVVEVRAADGDYFELDQRGDKPVIRANTWVNAAVGLNWYLKYYCGIHLSWNQMQAHLPARLPAVTVPERHETDLGLRYDFNYCTFSYTMAFWDWERWEREIDWMALHGINIPLAAVGNECVWRNMLRRQGYTDQQIGRFIAGPAFLAWWEMNNLEGWGGPLPDSWYEQQQRLQQQILRRMRQYGMHPVLPGYSGMCPSFIGQQGDAEALTEGLSSGESNQSSLQLWNGFTRPGVLYPGDPRFDAFARDYYEESHRLYGQADYYAMDPFHEASHLPADLDIGAAGGEVLRAMKQYGNRSAVWVLQGWSENPRPEMLQALPIEDVLVLDLFSECRPQYGAPNSIWHRPQGYGGHDWCFCMLENFGANVGMHGRMDQLLGNYYAAREQYAEHMRGWGLTMEGSETNPIMYELMSELPWRSERISRDAWVREYVRARYGLDHRQQTLGTAERDTALGAVYGAWQLLAQGIYNCPQGNNQQGPHESIFCSRPSLHSFQASSWSKMTNYYDPRSTLDAATLMVSQADALRGNDNYEYDLVDLCRQAIADQARITYHRAVADFQSFDRQAFRRDSQRFLHLLLLQDSLLATRSEFRVGRWLGQARSLGRDDAQRDLYEWNARVQITTWGNRYCADQGGLRDYAHKEWEGLLRDFYYVRWQHYFALLQQQLDGQAPVLPVGNSSTPTAGNPAVSVDWYAIEEPWTLRHNEYEAQGRGDAIEMAKHVMEVLQYER